MSGLKKLLLPVAGLILIALTSGCSTIRDLRMMNEDLGRRLDTTQKELTGYKDSYATLKAQYETAGTQYLAEVDRIQREKAEQQSLHEQQVAEWGRSKREILRNYDERLKTRASSELTLRQEIVRLSAEAGSLKTKLEEAEANRASLANQLQTEQTATTQRSAQLEKAAIEIASLTASVTDFETKLAERDEEIAQLKEDAASARNQAAGLQDTVKTKEQQSKESMQTLSQAEKALEALRKEVADRDKTIAAQLKTIEEKDGRLAQSQTRVKSLESEKKGATASLDTAKRSIQQRDNAENIVLYRLKEALTDVADASHTASSRVKQAEAQLTAVTDYLSKARSDATPPDTGVKELHARAVQNLKELSDAGMLSVGVDRRGVVISIPNETIYESREPTKVRSSSAVIDMLSRIANLAQQPPYYTVMVEGHTDSDPIQRSIFLDNLHLSMARAVNVTRKLTDDLEPRISPDRVRAVACGEYYPISTNKAKNRRIEIVFTPLY